MTLADVAADTIAITTAGSYLAPSSHDVDIAAHVGRAVDGTRLLRSADSLAAFARARRAGCARIEVTGERTGAAAKRLVDDGARSVGLLNFANGVRPGGGFLHGARAQEEALCRCSALYACLSSSRAAAFYAEQEAADTALVLDHVLVSPDVPFFRDEELRLLDAPFTATVLTAAAPDLGWLHARVDSDLEPASRYDDVPALFARRARCVLGAAADAGVDALVLGAWGCGAFGNDADVVAAAFAGALNEAGAAVALVVFAVWESEPPSSRRRAFAAALAQR